MAITKRGDIRSKPYVANTGIRPVPVTGGFPNAYPDGRGPSNTGQPNAIPDGFVPAPTMTGNRPPGQR